MFTKVAIVRKVISGILMSLILSLVLLLIHGYTSFFVYFIYFLIGTFVIGVPFSIVTDLILSKKKMSISYLLQGLVLHLVFAGIIVFLLTFTESDDMYPNVLINSVFGAAVGLWLVDSFLKKIPLNN
ncbi:hypothetical protein LOZ80_28700 [Paenibacillus sp. HWE-109]|uniref:hypothetical protein n=1 Tax=Paenibacillus sp. HWE-109 TaxID=1306526 RepID=UPI001EE0FA34|nr:hypothetical protein [Paenibacillus sp. HWE-109]UKS25535.1 hypothetical protein LOZ80_28700 [Paenibacillus sp. HWE-109]